MLSVYKNIFNKLCLLNDIANEIAYYGVKCGAVDLMDYIDMNCGAVPEGQFEQIIDISAPDQFLKLYVHIAESRFAVAVTSMLKIKEDSMPVLQDFVEKVGKDNFPEKLQNISQVFELIDAFILDGMPEENKRIIKFQSENEIQWENSVDTHKSFWEKAGGDLKNYYTLQKSLINGLLAASEMEYSVEDNLFLVKNK